MKWTKQGLVFKVSGEKTWMQSHAVVPFAEHLQDDLFRIYFSTRDGNNKSNLGYIEIDISNPNKILKMTSNAILTPGDLGTFDDSGAMGSCIVNFKDSKYLYYQGWNLGVTVPYRNSIGLAISKDKGKNFKKFSIGPILERNYLEPHFVGTPFVLIEDMNWKMWYLSCVKWELRNGKPNPYYHIKFSKSKDGVNWERKGDICIDFKNDKEWAIARPCVQHTGNTFKMWYSYRGEKPYRIGYAESKNGINWERMDDEIGIDVSESGWDSEMIEYPFVFEHKGTTYMLYNGNSYGKTGFGLAIKD